MVAAILSSPAARHVEANTRSHWLRLREIEKQRQGDVNAFAAQCIAHVRQWSEFADQVDDANQQGLIEDYSAIGDHVAPWSAAALDLLRGVSALADSLDPQRAVEVAEAILQMDEVHSYFESFPQTNSEATRRIREEIARGESRPFEDFANEACAADHDVRREGRS